MLCSSMRAAKAYHMAAALHDRTMLVQVRLGG